MKKVVVGISGPHASYCRSFAKDLQEKLQEANVLCEILSFSSPVYKALAKIDNCGVEEYKQLLSDEKFPQNSVFHSLNPANVIANLTEFANIIMSGDMKVTDISYKEASESSAQVIIFDDLQTHDELHAIPFDVAIRLIESNVRYFPSVPFLIPHVNHATSLDACMNVIMGLLTIYHRSLQLC